MRSPARRRTFPRANSVTILGAGSLGSALAAQLACSCWSVTLWSRRFAAASKVARSIRMGSERELAIGARRGLANARERSVARASERRAVVEDGRELALAVERELASAVSRSRVLVVCVRDDALDELVARLAALGRPRSGSVVVHTSGARARAVLSPLADLGWHTAALHPLIARAAPERRSSTAWPSLPRCAWGLETDDRIAARVARSIARACDGGSVFALSSKPAERADYHLAATLLSNGALALFDVVLEDVLPRSLRSSAHREAFAQLLAHTAANLGRATHSSRALTGPVVRGDRSTIRAHVAALRGRPRARELYVELSARLVQLARRSGRLDAKRAREIERLLSSARTRSVGSARSRR